MFYLCFNELIFTQTHLCHKVCRNCVPPSWNEEFLPTEVIVEVGKRALKRLRTALRDAGLLVRNAMPDRNTPGRLGTKINKYFKTMLPNEDDDEMVYFFGSTVVWHRDVVAAKCIMYKGMCC